MDLFDSALLKEHKIVDWGYTEVPEPVSYSHYDSWVKENKHLPLNYLADHRKEKREDIRHYFPEFQSALVFLFSYQSEKRELEEFYQSDQSNKLKIAGYVMGFDGLDYHHQVKYSLHQIEKTLQEKVKNLDTKLTLDIHPVLERDLAYRAGLGWFGKNSMFISKDYGSFTIIGSLLLNQKLPLKKRELEPDHCGQCTACLPACPTDAIDSQRRQIITNQCLSTFTIELFKDADPIPGSEGTKEIFGCDICQDVCPWNERLLRINGPQEPQPKSPMYKKIGSFFLTRPKEEIIGELEQLSNKKYQKLFKDTPLERTGRVGMLKNLKALILPDTD